MGYLPGICNAKSLQGYRFCTVISPMHMQLVPDNSNGKFVVLLSSKDIKVAQNAKILKRIIKK